MLELWVSSSVVSATLGGADVPISLGPTLRDSLSAFCRCSSSSTCSTGMASSMFSVAVGRMARTVKVQSSWFCSNRRRRLPSYELNLHTVHVVHQHTSPWRCAPRSCAVSPRTASPAHIAPPDSRPPVHQRRWRSSCGSVETIVAWSVSYCAVEDGMLPSNQGVAWGCSEGRVAMAVARTWHVTVGRCTSVALE